MKRFLSELKRRNVYKVAAAYAVVAFVVWQAAGFLFPALRFPGWTVDFVVVLTLLGFPVALVIAWAFELTPEGVRRTPSDTLAAGPPPSSPDAGDRERTDAEKSRLAVQVFVAVGVLAGAAAGAWYLTGSGGGAQPGATGGTLGERSIAVLPLDHVGGEENVQFAQGIHDGLSTRLSTVSGFTVTSRRSVVHYAGMGLPTPAIADSLDVRWLLEGRVLRDGNEIQLNVRLVDPRTDTQAWSDQYRRDLTAGNVFDIQAEITRQIASALRTQLTSEEEERIDRRPTENLQAYGLYARGRSSLDARTRESLTEGLRLFQRALEEDSTLAPAWAGLADAVMLLEERGFEVAGDVPDPLAAARRALELDPSLAEAHASVGQLRIGRRDGPGGLRALERAVELAPSYAQAHHWLGLALFVLGRPERSLDHLSLAIDLNPRNFSARGWLADALRANGEVERALEVTRRTQRMYPDRPEPMVFELYALRQLERWSELEARARAILAASPDPDAAGWAVGHVGLVHLARGDTVRARNLFAEAMPPEVPSFNRALVHAALGEEDDAFRALRDVPEWGVALTANLRYRFEDVLAPLHDDPRWERLLREVDAEWGLEPDGTLPAAPRGARSQASSVPLPLPWTRSRVTSAPG